LAKAGEMSSFIGRRVYLDEESGEEVHGKDR
jgi:hypothetical protein